MTNSSSREYSKLPSTPLAEILNLAKDSGYKGIDQALAEIIDNALDWGSKNIEIILLEKYIQLKRRSKRIYEIAVIDDGEGMNEDVLDRALQITGSQARGRDKKKGKFGVGLVYSSMYAANRLDVWSWQDIGAEHAIHNFIDKPTLKETNQEKLFYPTLQRVPQIYHEITDIDLGNSGTIVRWSNLNEENNDWRQGQTVINHSGHLMGRMFRYALKDNVSIKFKLVEVGDNNIINDIQISPLVRVDPLYLEVGTNTPPPYDKKPMFTLYTQEEKTVIDAEGEHTCVITCSHATEEALLKEPSDKLAGKTPYGLDAFKNRGVSVVREDRELFLDQNFYNGQHTQDRFWKIEVKFNSDLDYYFGITHDKQSVKTLERAFDRRLKTVKDPVQFKIYREEAADTKNEFAYTIAQRVYDLSLKLRAKVKEIRSTKNDPTRDNGAGPSTTDQVEAESSEYIRQWNKLSGKDDADSFENIDESKREEFIRNYTDELVEDGMTPDAGSAKARKIVETSRNISIRKRSIRQIREFFWPVEQPHNLIDLNINTTHPFYDLAFDAIESAHSGNLNLNDQDDLDEVKERLRKSEKTLYKMLVAWSYHESQLFGESLEQAEEMRTIWSEKLRDLIKDDVAE